MELNQFENADWLKVIKYFDYKDEANGKPGLDNEEFDAARADDIENYVPSTNEKKEFEDFIKKNNRENGLKMRRTGYQCRELEGESLGRFG